MLASGDIVEVPGATGPLSARIAGGRSLGTLDIRDAPGLPDAEGAIRTALLEPVGLDAPVFNDVRPGEQTVILVSDSFRNTRADQMLPPMLDMLSSKGVHDDHVQILFSTGTHRGPTPDEQRTILGGEIFERFRGRLATHDAHDQDAMISLGQTSRGTPVEVNRKAVETDHLYATGTVVLHYFGGYGGGRKSVVPGVASAKTIAHNHSLNLHPTQDRLDPAVRIGALDGNPVAEDMLEASNMVHVDAIINTVLNRDGEIAAIFAGEMDTAHREACAFARKLYTVPITERADLVIAASPHTKNFVQTHKALFNAFQALKPGGQVVLVAPCPEGLGGEQFEKWLDFGNPEAIIAALRKQSDINGQTALSTISKAPQTILLTQLDQASTGKLGMATAKTLQEAVDLARKRLKSATPCTFLAMPSAAYSVPVGLREQPKPFV